MRELVRATFQENKALNPPVCIELEGLGRFGARVLYAQPVRGLSYLLQLQAAFREAFIQNNITTDIRQNNNVVEQPDWFTPALL